MKFAASLASLALFVAAAVAQATINTPMNVVVCQPTLISWNGGTPPYTVTLRPAAAGASTIKDLTSGTDATQYTWQVDVAPGAYGLNLRDSTGAIFQSGSFDVAGDAGCLSSSTSATATESGTSSTGALSTTTSITTTTSVSSMTGVSSTGVLSTTTSVATSTAVSTTGGLSTSRSVSSSRSVSGSTAPSVSTTPSSAGSTAANVGLAGLVGAVAALVLA